MGNNRINKTKEVIPMMLGEKIHQLRKGQGMSQEELASQLTFSRQAVSKWELGESVPDTENVMQLSKLFSVSTDYLLNDEYESDKDIPAVKVGNETLKKEYRSNARKSEYWLTCIALLGILTMWVLSFQITAMRSVVKPWDSAVKDGIISLDDSDPVRYSTPIEARGELGAFIETYHLTPIFTICCVLAFIGIILLLYSFNVFKRNKSK